MSRLVLWTCLLLGACSREPGGDPLRVVPADLGQGGLAAVAPSLGLLQQRSASFLAGIEGASGVLDLLADRFGLDLRTPEGPDRLGLDAEHGFAVFSRHGAWVVAASVDDPDRFLAATRERLQKGAGAQLAAGQPDEPPDGGAWLFDGPGWRAALGVTRDGIGILVIAEPSHDVVATWNAIATGRAETSFSASEKGRSAIATIGADAVLYLAVDQLLPEAPARLGLLRGFVQNLRDRLPLFTGGVALGASGDALRLQLSAQHQGEGALPIGWFTPDGEPDALARAFPKTTTAFLRFRVALGNVRSLPGFIRDNVLPERLPGLEKLPLPAVSDLIDLIEGDVAVGLLGLDANANLAQLSGLVAHPERALSLFHVALAARVRSAGAVRDSFAAIASQLQTSGWTVAPVNHPAGTANPYQGWSLVRDQQRYAVLIDDQVVVFIVGGGEVDAFLAVKEGRGLALAAFAETGSGVVKQALGQEGATPLGFTVSPLRLSRELSARGLPPYFLKIINGIRLLSGNVGASAEALELALEIGL